jgi:diaminopimelate epimerase
MEFPAIKFSKLSGAGNDFLLIDNRQYILKDNLGEFIRKVCRRGMSVGADGVILVEPSDKADFRMRYFNADGGEAETCGNGSRCVSRFAYLKGIAPAQMTFETLAGMYKAEVFANGRVKVQVSNPKDLRMDINLPMSFGNLPCHFINTGVPHVVVVMEEGLEAYDIFNVGKEIRYHKEFAPAGTNANFVQVVGKDTVRIRTYERGVENETLACGTGSIASAMILNLLGKCHVPSTLITQSGQILNISFDIQGKDIQNVFLEGEARLVYEGELTPEAFV